MGVSVAHGNCDFILTENLLLGLEVLQARLANWRILWKVIFESGSHLSSCRVGIRVLFITFCNLQKASRATVETFLNACKLVERKSWQTVPFLMPASFAAVVYL
jgi:hypothetical protein